MIGLGIFRGKLKGAFFVSRIHYLVHPFARLGVFLYYLSSLSKWIHTHKNLRYSDFYRFRFSHDQRYTLYGKVVQSEQLDHPIDYLEFGVYNGSSFRWWVEHNAHTASRFYGFDTFEGLPENWGDLKKGHFSTGSQVPDIDDTRVQFIKGFFQDTLLDFLKDYHPERRKVIHMDADLYSSTLFTLTCLAPYLRKNDIVLFDEFNVPLHEFKAFTDFAAAYYIQYEVLGAVNNYYQLALKITGAPFIRQHE